jgi:prolyl-tRNA editing enzyme YbaK/EbsC (Cys-tRNA(Pro) deacylase)
MFLYNDYEKNSRYIERIREQMFTIMAPDMKRASEIYFKGGGTSFNVKLTPKDLENLKTAL